MCSCSGPRPGVSSVGGDKRDKWEEAGKGREEDANEGRKLLRNWPVQWAFLRSDKERQSFRVPGHAVDGHVQVK